MSKSRNRKPSPTSTPKTEAKPKPKLTPGDLLRGMFGDADHNAFVTHEDDEVCRLVIYGTPWIVPGESLYYLLREMQHWRLTVQGVTEELEWFVDCEGEPAVAMTDDRIPQAGDDVELSGETEQTR